MVDHPCEKCGAEVADGRPFCPTCGAPQVRVEFAPLPSVQANSTPKLTIEPDSLTHTGAIPPGDPAFFRTALQAGFLGVMANLIPFGLGMVLTGILAVVLYHRAERRNLGVGRAARLGAVAGAIAFATIALLTVLSVIVFSAQQQFHELMLKALEKSVANQSGPDVQSFLETIHTTQGFEIVLGIGMVGAVLLSMLFSATGAMIGSVLFRDRNRPPL